MFDSILKFLKKQDSEDSGLEVGGATTGGLAIKDLIKQLGIEGAEDALGSAKSREDFYKMLHPGDVLFTRSTRNLNPDPWEAEVMKAFGGSPQYHAGVYTGRGNFTHSPGGKIKAKNARLQEYADSGKGIEGMKGMPSYGHDVVAYRPKERDMAKEAIKRLPSLKGKAYPTGAELLAYAAQKHILPAEICDFIGDKQICTDVPAKAYGMSGHPTSSEIKGSGLFEPVARYNKAGPLTLGEKIETRAIYPILKNLKWGLLAGGAAGAGSALYQFLARHGNGRENA